MFSVFCLPVWQSGYHFSKHFLLIVDLHVPQLAPCDGHATGGWTDKTHVAESDM